MKKITLLTLLLVCAIGFSQRAVSNLGVNNPVVYGPQKAQQQSPASNMNGTPVSRVGVSNFIDAIAAGEHVNLVQPDKKGLSSTNYITPRSTNSAIMNQLGSDYVTTYSQKKAKKKSSSAQTAVTSPIFNFVATTSNGANSFTRSSSVISRTSNLNPPAGTTTKLSNGTLNSNRMPVVITHSVTQNVTPANSVTCNAGGIPTENSFFRDFDLAGDFGIAGDFDVTDVEFAIEVVTGPVNLTLNIYSLAGTFPANYGSAVLQGTASYTANVGEDGTIVSVPLVATIPAGEHMIYEYRIDAGATFSLFPGSNADGETGPSYIAAADCGIASPTPLSGIGFPNQHMVMNVVGDEAGGGGGGGSANTVMYLHHDTDPVWNADVQAQLMAAGIPTVDLFDGTTGIPTLAQLQAYDAVLLSTDFAPADPVALGDVLAEYADGGGGIVEMLFSPQGPWNVGGNFAANYSLWSATGVLSGTTRTLGTVNDPAHPIMQGVATFSGGSTSFHLGGSVQNGGVVIAEYDNGTPLVVAVEGIGPANVNHAYLNFFPPSDATGSGILWDSTTDGAIIMKNALDWVSSAGGGGGGCVPGSLATTLAGGNGNFGNMFDINALTDLTIDSFDIHGDTGATFDVEVWAKTGTWVGFENNMGAWTLIGTAPGVVSNGDGVTTPLNLTLGYAMAAGETHAFYVVPTDTTSGGFNYTNGTTVGAVFASDANIEFLEGAGNAYPFGTTFQPRIFNGNILYCVGGGGGGGCATGTFADRPAFEAAFGGTLNDEDFTGGPTSITACDGPINSGGNSCFPAGEIIDGLDVRSLVPTDPSADTVVIPVGAFGNSDVLVGPNTFVDVLEIQFPNNDVNSFGVDIWMPLEAGAVDVDVRVFGASGLIEALVVNVPGGATPAFLGYIAGEIVTRVEIENVTSGGGELISMASIGECTGGGGGGPVCSEENPNDFTFENGLNCSSASAFQTANDVTVADGEDFEINQITASIFANGGIALVDVIYYDDAGGLPGAVIGSESGIVPTSQVVIGSNFGFDVNEIVLDLTPFTFAGQNGSTTTYWTELSVTDGGGTGSVFWVVTSSSAVGNPTAQFNGGWGIFDPVFDGVYIWSGECNPLPPDPTYDTCDGALPISCGEIAAGSTIGATVDSAVAPTCDTTVTAPGVWYVYQDTTGLVTDITITTCNGTTDYDAKLSVYTGDCGSPPLTCVVGNDDTCGLQPEVSFQSDGATTFYILVHGFASNVGNFEIEMICTPVPPPNDMIANSIDVDEIGFPYTDPSVAMPAATTEAGTPAGCDNAGVKGVWYNFVPTGDGDATASITTPGGGLMFTVNNGPLAGNYPAVAAAFGGDFTSTPITEDTAVVIDDNSGGGTDPNDACENIINGAALNGKIAIIRRGACAFTQKVLAAQNEGAIAVIMVNNVPGDPIIMGGTEPLVTIPALMLSDVNGEAIIAEVSGGGTVNVTMVDEPAAFSSVTFYTAPNENAVETDLTLVDYYLNQCVPGIEATILTTAGQAYYVYVSNPGAITDIVIDGTNLGIEDNTIEGFTYYPNPTTSTLNLSSVENIENVEIYNMLGQKVIVQNINATTSEISVSELSTGTYIMKVSVNGQIGTYKILKQ
jgi:hypothetical protein